MDPGVEGTWEPNSLAWVDPQVLPLGDICQVATQRNPAMALAPLLSDFVGKRHARFFPELAEGVCWRAEGCQLSTSEKISTLNMIFENSSVIKSLMTWNHSRTLQMCVYMRAEE